MSPGMKNHAIAEGPFIYTNNYVSFSERSVIV